MRRYRLSRRADQDLFEIFRFGIETFGLLQAEQYQTDLTHCFDLLAQNPRLGRPADIIAPGLRRHEHARHIILYEIETDGVLILTILHQRRLLHLV